MPQSEKTKGVVSRDNSFYHFHEITIIALFSGERHALVKRVMYGDTILLCYTLVWLIADFMHLVGTAKGILACFDEPCGFSSPTTKNNSPPQRVNCCFGKLHRFRYPFFD